MTLKLSVSLWAALTVANVLSGSFALGEYNYKNKARYFTIVILYCVRPECPSLRHLTNQGDGGERSLPPLVESVSVTTYATAFLPEELFAYSYPFTDYAWCSFNAVEPHNITITMTEQVILYGLLSGGYESSSTSAMRYVTAFSMEYSTDDISHITP